MEITIETTTYNERRYGKPWIARVDFAGSTKGDFEWGDWTGDHWNGGEGVLSITANLGDIIATGQKDNRKPRNSAPDFFVVELSGELGMIGDKGDAYKHYLANKNLEERKEYQWSASALTGHEMAILTNWREKTNLPICQLLRQAVIEIDNIIKERK